ncbi:10768_t:CDS:2, partial [Ambispora leptoticha]
QPVSRSTISRLYKKYGITHKKIGYHYSEQQSFLEKIKPFVDKVKSLSLSQLMAEDECAFYLNEAPRRAWGWKGERKGTKAVDFHDFIKEIYFLNDEKYYLLLDNASIHKAIKACLKKDRLPIRELFTQMNIDPLYLVPYTPQLNPVELCFNFLRKFVEEHEPRTYEELK